MPTWSEVAKWLEENTHVSGSWDYDAATNYDLGRADVIHALQSKAALEERKAELEAQHVKLYRTVLHLKHWPKHTGPVMLIQFIRDDEVVLSRVIDKAGPKWDGRRMRMLSELRELEAESQKLPDRAHYIDVEGNVGMSEGLRRIG